jgi:branched-subunit amino acid aminotransferase/4-amino-4-deoxychorismate lyase
MPAVKHTGLFGALRCRRLAHREGFDDALLLNPDGTISELVTSNIGFVRDGQTIWPRSEWLTGVTMTLLHEALDEPMRTEALTLADLPAMECVFATNSATGVRPVASVNDRSWPTDHPMLKQLQELYAGIPAERL